MSEWQPIETAPKDGTRILLHRRKNQRGRLWKPVVIGRWKMSPPTYWVLETRHGAAQDIDISGWIPLPEVPDEHV